MGSGASRRDAFYINKLVEMRDSLISDMDDEMLQMFGIEEIMNLTEKKPLYMEAFCKEEVTARIVESMTRWKANELVIRAATKMFTFSLLEDDCAEQLRKLNGKKLLEELLVIHKYDNFVTEDGGVCLELLFETCNKVGQQKIEAAYKNKDPLEICAVMREHPYKPKVQELGVTCLAYLTEASTELIEKMKEDETTIPTVCFAMEEYYTNHRTVMFGLNVMCNWAEEPEGRSLVGKLGGIPRVMEALVEFSGWGEREHEKQQEAEVKKRALERANKARKIRKRVKVKKVEEEVVKRAPRNTGTHPFVTDLHLCQIAIYTVAKLLDGNPRNVGHFEEFEFWKLLTYLIHRFDELEYKPPLVIPLVMRRGYVTYQRALLAKIEAEKAGIVQKRSALEQEKYEDTLIRRRQEYQPCIYAQTVGRGSCYRHCVECFAVDGICDAHLDRHDHVAEMLNKFDDAEK
jgi:hypothetical protein